MCDVVNLIVAKETIVNENGYPEVDVNRMLIGSFKERIEGYGLTSDLLHLTFHGIPLKEAEKFEKIWEEFEEDPELEPYEFNSPNCPSCTIPRGTLYIYGKLKQPMTNDDIARAIGWVKTYVQHSYKMPDGTVIKQHKMLPYWDDDGGYMSAAWDGAFEPTTDADDALQALDHLIDSEKITEEEVCKMICDFIIKRKKQL